MHRRRDRQIVLLAHQRHAGVGAAVQIDHLLFSYAQLGGVARRGQDHRRAQLDRILRHHPAAIGIVEPVVAMLVGQQFRRCPLPGKLRMFASQRHAGKGFPQFRHALRIADAIHSQPRPPGVFNNAIGHRHIDNALPPFIGGQHLVFTGNQIGHLAGCRLAPVEVVTAPPGPLDGPHILRARQDHRLILAGMDLAGELVQMLLRALAADIAIKQSRGVETGRGGDRLGMIFRRTEVVRQAAVMKQANRQQAVNRRRQRLFRAAVGQRLLNRGRRQIDRRGPFKTLRFFQFLSARFADADQHRRPGICQSHC